LIGYEHLSSTINEPYRNSSLKRVQNELNWIAIELHIAIQFSSVIRSVHAFMHRTLWSWRYACLCK